MRRPDACGRWLPIRLQSCQTELQLRWCDCRLPEDLLCICSIARLAVSPASKSSCRSADWVGQRSDAQLEATHAESHSRMAARCACSATGTYCALQDRPAGTCRQKSRRAAGCLKALEGRTACHLAQRSTRLRVALHCLHAGNTFGPHTDDTEVAPRLGEPTWVGGTRLHCPPAWHGQPGRRQWSRPWPPEEPPSGSPPAVAGAEQGQCTSSSRLVCS